MGAGVGSHHPDLQFGKCTGRWGKCLIPQSRSLASVRSSAPRPGEG